MPRGKPRTPPPQKSRSLLNRADTAETATSFEQPSEPIPQRQRGERVDAPTAEMRGPAPINWGKVGVLVTVGTTFIGLLITGIWHYGETVNSVKSLGSDVAELKRKADDLFRTSVDSSARLSNLERRTHSEAAPLPPMRPQASSAPK